MKKNEGGLFVVGFVGFAATVLVLIQLLLVVVVIISF